MDERVMIFVDGSNLLRGIGEEINISVNSLKPPDDLISLACLIVDSLWDVRLSHDLRVGGVGGRVIRSYWFGSFEGSEEDGTHLQELLRRRDFEPVLFHKPKRQGKEKRVDLAIAREMLLNAFQQNYQVAVLVAGAEDYLDLVQDIKRFGIRVNDSWDVDSYSALLIFRATHPYGLVYGECWTYSPQDSGRSRHQKSQVPPYFGGQWQHEPHSLGSFYSPSSAPPHSPSVFDTPPE